MRVTVIVPQPVCRAFFSRMYRAAVDRNSVYDLVGFLPMLIARVYSPHRIIRRSRYHCDLISAADQLLANIRNTKRLRRIVLANNKNIHFPSFNYTSVYLPRCLTADAYVSSIYRRKHDPHFWTVYNAPASRQVTRSIKKASVQ